MNILMIPFLLVLSLESPDYTIHATPIHKSCENGQPEWHTSRGSLVVLDPYTVRLTPDGPGAYEVWANIIDAPGCGGYLDFEVAEGTRKKK